MKNQLQTWLTNSFICSLIVLSSSATSAQITPDNTLGAESSLITPNILINGANADTLQQDPKDLRIDGGAQRGSNLFHSFSQFNIGDGQRVHFVNPSDVQNIFTRVTGGQASNIYGTLGVEGTANLFLLNPNGILFGPNSRLDVRGSFVGTTANAVRFGDLGVFSATNPFAPPLLSVNPSALLFNQINQGTMLPPGAAQGAIVNQSQADAGVNPIGENVTGLRVPDTKSLLLVGGNVNIDGGGLRAYGGNIELAAVGGIGDVGIKTEGGNFGLTIANEIQRGDISLTNGADVNVRGADGGNIKIHARNVNMAGESKLRAGIATGLGTPNSKAGNIEINATGTTTLTSDSFIANVLQERAFGQAGDIKIATNSLNLTDQSILNANIFGNGNGGKITLNAADTISFDGYSYASANVYRSAQGNGGDIEMKTRSLSLTNGGQITSDVLGQGNAGNIIVEARDTVKLDGVYITTADYTWSSISNALLIGSVGKAGDIQVTTGALFVTNGAAISSDTYGRGNAGNITINARDTVVFEGFGDTTFNSQASTIVVGENSVGNGGDIRITAGTLLLKNGGGLKAFNGGQGNSGSIILDVRDTVRFDGVGAAGVPSSADTFAVNGSGGNVQVKTGSLFLTNGGSIATAVFERGGNAGNITIDARDTVKIDGIVSNVTLLSGKVYSAVSGLKSSLLEGEGRGGDIQITTGSLSVTNGAEISSATNGRGNAGNITINARDNVSFDGVGSNRFNSNATSGSLANGGNGGDIRINAKALSLTNSGGLQTFSTGQGNAGTITIDTLDTVTVDGISSRNLPSQISTFATGNGNGGDIQVKTGTLTLTNGGNFTTSAFRNSGNIIIDARDAARFEGINSFGLPSGVLSFLNSGGVGKGGSIQLSANSLTLSNGALLNASTSGQGNAGNITMNIRENTTIEGVNLDKDFTGIFTGVVGAKGQGNGGDIQLTTGSLLVRGGAISTSTAAKGDAGNITINARDAIVLEGNSGILTIVENNGTGKAGNTDISAGTIRISNQAQLSANTVSGNGGNINLNARELLILRRGGLISTTAGTAGAGGDGGNITINAPFIIAVTSENSDITANAYSGNGGNITISAQSVFGLQARSQQTSQSDITASSQLGVQGQININQPDIQPTQGLIERSVSVLDASNQIAQNCATQSGKSESSFYITGKGGLPVAPGDLAISYYPTGEVRSVVSSDFSNNPKWTIAHSDDVEASKMPDPIVEAQEIVKTADGEIMLVAQATTSAATTLATIFKCPH